MHLLPKKVFVSLKLGLLGCRGWFLSIQTIRNCRSHYAVGFRRETTRGCWEGGVLLPPSSQGLHASSITFLCLSSEKLLSCTRAFNLVNCGLQEKVLRCCEVIKDMELMRSRPLRNDNISFSSVPPSSIGVSSAVCLSCKDDDLTVESHATSHHNSSATKRRKPSRQWRKLGVHSSSACQVLLPSH